MRIETRLSTPFAAGTATAIVAIGLAWAAGATAAGDKGVRSARPSSIAKCPTIPGSTSGDYEVVFGRKRIRQRAVVLLRKVRKKGFRRAVIEREACIFEVAVIHLKRRQAQRIAGNASRVGFRVRIMQS